MHRVSVNGRRADWRLDGEELVITPRKALRKHKQVQDDGDLHLGPDALGARRPVPGGLVHDRRRVGDRRPADRGNEIYPVNDHPSDKATYRYALLVPDGMTAVANGRLTGQRDFGARTLWTYEMHEPMASQLIQLAVGDLDVIRRGRVTGVHLRDVVASNAVATSEPTLATTPDHMRWMVDKIGRYPFDTYGVLAADQVFFYALETQTLSLHPTFLFDPAQFPDQEFAQTIMVHELAHQWFGDDVAIATWSDLWLSEGHATWYEQEYAAEVFGADFVAFMREEYRVSDQQRAAFGPPARPASAETLFEKNVYGGGAPVLYALRQEIGDRAFRKLQRAWVDRYGGKSATTDEFVALASKVARRRPAGVHGAMALQHHDAADAGASRLDERPGAGGGCRSPLGAARVPAVGQRFARPSGREGLAGAEQPAHDRAGRHLQAGRGLLVGEAEQVDGHERVALVVGKVGDAGVELARLECALGVGGAPLEALEVLGGGGGRRAGAPRCGGRR